jgi:hypothetical protein
MNLAHQSVERSLPARWLLVALAGWLVADVVLLQPFLGQSGGVTAAWTLVATLLVGWVARALRGMADRVSWRTLGICVGVAVVLLLLGGEGRLLYANLDWRVRDGVLHDMAVHPWPFAYTARGLPEILRAPLGMYLLPSLAMKAGGQAAGDWALLAQNTVLLAIMLALGSTLFEGRRRIVALAVFVAFSGLDVVGDWLAEGFPLADHLESWAGSLQYSSHVTQLFWVPQHAFAGWIGALGFMLWRDRGLPLGVFLALVPLTVLWSPLGALGVLPFAAMAGVMTLIRRELRVSDVALPALACAAVLPVLLYLSADASAVGGGGKLGGGPGGLRLNAYVAFVALEAAPLLLIAGWSAKIRPLGVATLAVVAAMLLLLPVGQLGRASDSVMRVSIAPLALLALAVAEAAMRAKGARLAMVAVVLGLGAVTGLHEVRRALTFPVSPPPRCSFYGAWGPSPAWHKSTYLAPIAGLPASIRPEHATLVPNTDPPRCWAGPWPVPSGATPSPLDTVEPR